MPLQTGGIQIGFGINRVDDSWAIRTQSIGLGQLMGKWFASTLYRLAEFLAADTLAIVMTERLL